MMHGSPIAVPGVRTLVGVFVTALAASGMVGVVVAPPAAAAPQTYTYTGGPQIYVVPPGVTSIDVTLDGGAGASITGGGAGGLGGRITAEISVQPGEVLQVMVGGSGANGGYNGGSGGGGGASDIRRPAFSTTSSCAYNLTCGFSQRIIVAGGGGGAGHVYNASGGGNGGAGGAAPTAGTSMDDSATPGGPGTLSGGGTGGTGGGSGGGSGVGAAGGTGIGDGNGGALGWKPGANGGGGGGGYSGGGGGGAFTNLSAAGGGGGSSWGGGAGVTVDDSTTGTRSGNGVVTIDPPSAITNAAFGLAGGPQYYSVPSDVSQLAIRVYGGGAAGLGDIVYGQLPVAPGSTLQVNIGGAGQWVREAPGGGTSGGAGGYNGGGSAGAGSGLSVSGGGGASDIRVQGSDDTLYGLEDRVVVAAGGGGCNSSGSGPCGNSWVPGHGGSRSGGLGGNGYFVWNPSQISGNGGSLTAGGTSTESSPPVSAAGQFGVGGSGTTSVNWGGGGGGYYGGAASPAAGGGSSFASVTGPDPTRQGVGNVLAAGGDPVSATRPITHVSSPSQGNVGDGMAVITAMPIGMTISATQVSYASAFIRGSVNPKYLASRPTVYYSSVDETTVANGGGSSTAVTGPSSAPVLAGDAVQLVSGSITSLSAGTTYYYRVCAQSVAGNGCGIVKSFTTPALGTPYFTADTPDDTGVAGTPYPPYSFAASSSPSSAITFGVGSGALPPGLTLDDSGLLSGTPSASGTYTFTVSATNGNGTTSTSAITITIGAIPTPPVPPTPAPPGTPTSVVASAGNAQASITWSPPASSGSFPVTSYRVTASPGGQSCLTVSTSCTISGLTNGTTYTFSVAALNGAGWGTAGTSDPVTPSANPEPTPAPGPQPLPAPLPPGGSSLTVNGVAQQMTVQPNTGSNGLQIASDDFDMTLDGLGPDGRPMDLGPDGVLVLDQEREAQSSGRGFLGRSDVDFYIDPPVTTSARSRSAGLFVGTLVTSPDGTFSGRVTLPDTISAGDHVLQAVGLTAQGQPRAISIGVRVSAWIQLDRGARSSDARHDRIRTSGDSAGIPAGTRLTPWIRYSGQDTFRQGTATIAVQADGTFRWTRQIRKDKAVTGYITYTDIESNRVTWARVR